jgi:energy-coupling factor transporter ATP-binding protein EcfA2
MRSRTELQTFTYTLARDLITVMAWVHAQDPYRYVSGVCAVALALAPYLIQGGIPKPLRISSVGGAIAFSLLAAKQFEDKAKQRDTQRTRSQEQEDDRQFLRQMQRGLLEELKTIQVDAQLRKAELQEFDGLPLWLHPYGKDIAKFDQEKADPVKGLLEGMLAGLDQALGEAIDVSATSEDSPSTIPTIASGQFVELDLAAEAAQSDKSLLISGITGVGKTTFLQHFIHAVHQSYSGKALFDVISFKSTLAHFCGLEQTGYYIESGASGANYDRAASKVMSVRGLLDSFVSDTPYYFIADEINNGLKQAEAHTETDEKGKVIKSGKAHLEELKHSLGFIVTQGRERKIRGCFTAHGNLMELLGIDSNTAQSLVCVVLGRKVEKGDGFSLIERLLETTQGSFFSKSARQRLVAQFPLIKAQASTTGRAIALTNIRGEWEFVFLPAGYAHDPGSIQWEAQNQSMTALIRSTPSVLPSVPPPQAIVPADLSTLTPMQSQVLNLLSQETGETIVPDKVYQKQRLKVSQWQWNQTILELAKLGMIQLIGASKIRLLVKLNSHHDESVDELSDRQSNLLEWAQEKGWLSPSKLQSDFRLFRDVSVEEIIADFEALTQAGYGTLRQKHGTVQWRRANSQTPDNS